MATRFACGPFLTAADFGTLVKCECELDGFDIAEVIDQASDALTLLSNGAITGRCTLKLRPCAEESCWCGATLADACGCCRLDGIRLPGVEPTVDQVLIDGAALDVSEYKIVNGDTLVRVEGNWPACQHLLLDSTEVGTFEITETYGDLPLLGRMAAAELTCELARELAAARGHPPTNWTSMSLDGLTISRDRFAIDPTGVVNEMESLGLRWTAKFLSLYGDGGTELSPVWSVETADQWKLFTFDAAEAATP